MDLQPHPLLHFLVRMKPTSPNVFLQVAKNVSHKGNDSICTENIEVFPSQISEAVMDGRLHANGWFHPTAFQGVLTLWCVAASSATKKRTTPLCSSLLASISNAGRTLYAHLQSNKETTMWICVFSLCMSPTLQMAVWIRNNNIVRFCKECVL